jgi:hypothetical protein
LAGTGGSSWCCRISSAEQQVGGLDVAMPDSLLMCSSQSSGCLENEHRRLVRVNERVTLDHLGQRISRGVLHRGELPPPVGTQLPHVRQVRVLDHGRCECLAREVGAEDRVGCAFGRQDLEHGKLPQAHGQRQKRLAARPLPEQS